MDKVISRRQLCWFFGRVLLRNLFQKEGNQLDDLITIIHVVRYVSRVSAQDSKNILYFALIFVLSASGISSIACIITVTFCVDITVLNCCH